MNLKPPVFIIGSGRCGTTLLYHMLLSSGGFVIYMSEIQIFNRLAPAYGNFHKIKQRKRFLKKWLSSEHFFRTGLDSKYITKRFLNECQSAEDFQRILMESMAEMQGAERWADCTPANILFMHNIKKSFQTAKFIHIIRDGRDVALSSSKQRWRPPFPWDKDRWIVPAALRWALIMEKSIKLRSKVEPDYIEIKYEDLISKPCKTLLKVGTFIGHNIDYNRILSMKLGTIRKPNTSFHLENEPNKFKFIQRWRSSYSEEDLKLVESLIRNQLEISGYKLSNSRDDLSLSIKGKVNCYLYRFNFGLRDWLRVNTLGRLFVDPMIAEALDFTGETDKTIRPSQHLEFIRNIVLHNSSNF